MVVLRRDQDVACEVLGSCLVEVESILSDRRLISMFSDASDQQPLMPSSLFLFRDSNGLPVSGGVLLDFRESYAEQDQIRTRMAQWKHTGQIPDPKLELACSHNDVIRQA